jgi:hypothetical protein
VRPYIDPNRHSKAMNRIHPDIWKTLLQARMRAQSDYNSALAPVSGKLLKMDGTVQLPSPQELERLADATRCLQATVEELALVAGARSRAREPKAHTTPLPEPCHGQESLFAGINCITARHKNRRPSAG